MSCFSSTFWYVTAMDGIIWQHQVASDRSACFVVLQLCSPSHEWCDCLRHPSIRSGPAVLLQNHSFLKQFDFFMIERCESTWEQGSLGWLGVLRARQDCCIPTCSMSFSMRSNNYAQRIGIVRYAFSKVPIIAGFRIFPRRLDGGDSVQHPRCLPGADTSRL
jgi:hypothetical protein